MPIVYVTAMDRSRQFYEHLGFGALSVSEWWTELRAGNGAVLALHRVDETELGESGRLELAVVATERLEVVMQRLEGVGIAVPAGVVTQPFGRSLIVTDPDGLHIQINEHDASKYDDGHTVAG